MEKIGELVASQKKGREPDGVELEIRCQAEVQKKKLHSKTSPNALKYDGLGRGKTNQSRLIMNCCGEGKKPANSCGWVGKKKFN